MAWLANRCLRGHEYAFGRDAGIAEKFALSPTSGLFCSICFSTVVRFAWLCGGRLALPVRWLFALRDPHRVLFSC